MVTAYSIFDNGGRKVEATLIDRIQDRRGRTIWKHDRRDCTSCIQAEYTPDMAEPELLDVSEQVMSPLHRLSDHLDAGRRGRARHGPQDEGAGKARCRQDRYIE